LSRGSSSGGSGLKTELAFRRSLDLSELTTPIELVCAKVWGRN